EALGCVQDVERDVQLPDEAGDLLRVGDSRNEHAVRACLLIGHQAAQGLVRVAAAEPVGVGAGVDEQVGRGGTDGLDLGGVPVGGAEPVLQVDADGARRGQ